MEYEKEEENEYEYICYCYLIVSPAAFWSRYHESKQQNTFQLKIYKKN